MRLLGFYYFMILVFVQYLTLALVAIRQMAPSVREVRRGAFLSEAAL